MNTIKVPMERTHDPYAWGRNRELKISGMTIEEVGDLFRLGPIDSRGGASWSSYMMVTAESLDALAIAWLKERYPNQGLITTRFGDWSKP